TKYDKNKFRKSPGKISKGNTNQAIGSFEKQCGKLLLSIFCEVCVGPLSTWKSEHLILLSISKIL
ncbi:hypothetical protein, partial [Klebsiella variicola]|uniref:hypothetical protein n=1 Tax=Klebsiella variicola TaxID=244366 RepID=UPI002731A956